MNELRNNWNEKWKILNQTYIYYQYITKPWSKTKKTMHIYTVQVRKDMGSSSENVADPTAKYWIHRWEHRPMPFEITVI